MSSENMPPESPRRTRDTHRTSSPRGLNVGNESLPLAAGSAIESSSHDLIPDADAPKDFSYIDIDTAAHSIMRDGADHVSRAGGVDMSSMLGGLPKVESPRGRLAISTVNHRSAGHAPIAPSPNRNRSIQTHDDGLPKDNQSGNVGHEAVVAGGHELELVDQGTANQPPETTSLLLENQAQNSHSLGETCRNEPLLPQNVPERAPVAVTRLHHPPRDVTRANDAQPVLGQVQQIAARPIALPQNIPPQPVLGQVQQIAARPIALPQNIPPQVAALLNRAQRRRQRAPNHQEYRLTADRFNIGRVIGTGAFAVVHAGRDVVNRSSVAVKVITRLPNFAAAEVSELEFLLACDHENIIRCHGSFMAPYRAIPDPCLHIVFDYANSGDLFDMLRGADFQLPYGERRRYLIQGARAIEYLHGRRIIHFDIKLENFLVHDGSLKLCDFGLAGRNNSIRIGRPHGTTSYMAPEYVSIRRHDQEYGLRPSADMWAFGIVMFATTFADLPWQRAVPEDLDYYEFSQYGDAIVEIEPFIYLSIRVAYVLVSLLRFDPNGRMSMTQVLEILEAEPSLLREVLDDDDEDGNGEESGESSYDDESDNDHDDDRNRNE